MNQSPPLTPVADTPIATMQPKPRAKRSWARIGCLLGFVLGVVSLDSNILGMAALFALGTLDDVGVE